MRSIKRALLFSFFALLMGVVTIDTAPATILWAGGEDIDVITTGSVPVSTTSTTFRSGYARASLSEQQGGTGSIYPATPRFATPVFANQTTVWIHAETFTTVTLIPNSDAEAIGLYGSDGNLRLMLKAHGTSSGRMDIATRNTAGTVTVLASCDSASWPIASALTKLDWFINYAVAGSTQLYINGTLHCTFTGDLTNNGITSLNQVEFASPVGQLFWSEGIVATTDTRDMNLFTCYPTANGTTMAWTGAYTNVNPTTINDASSVTTSSNNLVAEFACPSVPSGSFTVPAVTSALRLQIGSTGPQNFQFVTRPGSGSTDYFSGSVGGTTVFSNNYQIQATNPATAGSWSLTDIVNLQQGVKSIP